MCGTGRRIKAHGWLSVGLLLFTPAARGQDAVPPLVQAGEHFYGAVGTGTLDVSWTATPTDVPLDGEITLTLTVNRARNPESIRRPNLAEMPKLRDRFQVCGGPEERADGRVSFTNTLRPRAEGAIEIPGLRFDYYNPDAPEGKRVRTKYTDPIIITVRPPSPKTAAPSGPLEAPERFFQLADDSELHAGWPGDPGLLRWLGLLACVACGVGVWVTGWRLLNPGGVRLAKLRRNRAVRRALDGLAKAAKSPDPTAAAADVFRVYLIERFGLPPVGPVPADVGVAMRAAGVPAERVAEAVDYFRKCDAARLVGLETRPP